MVTSERGRRDQPWNLLKGDGLKAGIPPSKGNDLVFVSSLDDLYIQTRIIAKREAESRVYRYTRIRI